MASATASGATNASRNISLPAGKPKLYKPLILRIGEIPGLSPLRLFVVIAAVTCLVSWWLQTPLVTPLSTAYGLAMVNYLVRRHQRLLVRLRPLIALDDAHFQYEWYALTHYRGVVIIGSGLLAPILLIGVNWNSVALRTLAQGGVSGSLASLAWALVLALVDWILIMQVFVILISNAWRFYRLGRHDTRINLLDTAALAPFALAGIAVLVMFAGSYTLFPLVVADRAHLLGAALRSLVVCLPVLLAGTLLPIFGIHQNLHAAKVAELERVTRAIHGDRNALTDSHLAHESDTIPLSNLVLYRQMIEAISEWPVTSVGAARSALIVIVPIVAWIAGAVVDRVMDKLM